MRKIIPKFILLAFLFISKMLFAGEPDHRILPDSISQNLIGKSVKKRIEFLLFTVEQLQFKDVSTALIASKEALSIAQKNDLLAEEAISRYWLAELQFNQSIYSGNLEVIYANSDIAYSIFKKTNQKDWQIKCLGLMSEISNTLSIINQSGENSNPLQLKKRAINEVKDAIELHKATSGDMYKNISLGYLLNIKATIFNYQQPDSSMRWWLEAEQIFESKHEVLGLARINLNKALFSKSNNSIFFKKTINAYHELNNLDALKRAYLRYGTFCINQFEETEKEHWWQQGIGYLKTGLDLQENQNLCDALNRLGHAHAVKNKFEGNYQKNRLDSAGFYFSEAIYRSKKEYNAYCLGDFIQARKATCIRNGNCDQVVDDLILAYTLIMRAREGIITDAVKEKESYRQAIKAKEEAQRRKRMRLFYAGLFSLLGIIFYIVYQRQQIQKLESKTKAQEAKIQALGARMNPHFISNTLNAIDSMIFTGDKVEASNYLVKFSKLSRMVLANSEFTLISLKKEIEMLDYYLSLEKLRFGDEIAFKLKVDETLDLENTQIPPMLLQPFIENAILHGLKPKEGKGNVEISLRFNSNNELECIIEDDGVGRQKEKMETETERKSFSTQITEDRIDLLNKIEGATFKIEDLWKNGAAAGTRIIITLPKNLK